MVCAAIALVVLHKKWRQNDLDNITKGKHTKIGEGAFGEVYKGTYKDQQAAVKYSIAKSAKRTQNSFC
uniref:Protein kinase domain-containing protein n=1 Tax=Oryza barthii TaxID=65489 RepID=A0A0D3H395_9ORYZ